MSFFSPPPLPPRRRPGPPLGVQSSVDGVGAITGSGDLAGASAPPGAGALTGSGTLAGAGAALAAGAGALTGSGTLAGAAATFPLSVSANGRYLVQANGTPFLICADATWSIFVDIPLAGLSSFLGTIAAQGFNAVSGNAIEHHFSVVKPPKERGGLLPFTQRMDGTSYTGSPNGTTGASGTQGQFASDNYSNISNQAPDCTFVNNSYWVVLETILDACLANGLLVFVWPGYLGFNAGDEGWAGEMVAWDAVTGAGGFTGQPFADPTKTKMWNYGAWLAARWKNYGNIIWVMGGDYGSGTHPLTGPQSAAASNLMAGMKSVAGQQSLLFTGHWDRSSLSTDTALAAGSFDVNGCYSDDATAELARRGYAASPTKPVVGLEAYYEDSAVGGSAPWRKYLYWQFVGGIAGGFFGNEQLWRFDDGTPGTDYTTLLSTQSTNDAVRQFSLWRTLPWHRLKPSGLGGMGTLITAGGGTASPQSTDYVAAAATSEGDLLVAYVPPAHTGTITVSMTVMAASARARWFDPTNGTFTQIGVVANTGTHVFTLPGTNSAGDADFLLVLDTPAGALTGSGTLAGAGAALAAGAGALTGSGTLAGVGAASAAGSGTLAGSGTIAGVGAASAAGVGSVTGSGDLAGTGATVIPGSSALAGSGTIAGVGAELAAGVGALTGSGTIAGAGAFVLPGAGAGNLTGSGTLAGAGAALAAGAGALTGSGTLAGVGAALVAGAGALTGSGTLAGVAATTAPGAGVITGSGDLAGAAVVPAAGSIVGSGTIAGVSTSTPAPEVQTNMPPAPVTPSNQPAASAVIRQTSSRFSSVLSLDDLTPRYLQDNYLTGFTITGSDGQPLPPKFYEDKIADAIAKLESVTHIDVLERDVTGEKHDYHTNDYLNYAYLQLFRTPCQSISQVRAVYPTGQVIQVFPSEWVRVYVEHSQIHLVPTSGSLAQVMLGGGNGYLPFIFAGLSYLPNLWEVDYVSGFRVDGVPREVVSAVCKLAAIEVLTIASDLVGPLGIASTSLGIDGMSQSIARQLPAFKARIDQYRVDLGIPGPALGVDPKYTTGEIGQLRRTYLGMVAVSV